MRMKWRFPIRLKILVTLLLTVVTVVSVITFTMANLFHADKTTYIQGLTSVVSQHTAAEVGTVLSSHRDRLQAFARLLLEKDMDQERKARMLRQLFEDFREFVAITLYENGSELATVYDSLALEGAGLTNAALMADREKHPLPLERIKAGEVHVENSTLSDKLPALTLAFPIPSPENGPNHIVAAVIRLDSLLELTGRSRDFQTFIVDSRGQVLAHSDRQKTLLRTRVDWLPELQGLQNPGSRGTTLEYSRGGETMLGGFAPLPYSGGLAGVEVPKTAAYLTARNLLNNLLAAAVILVVASALLSLLWSRRITGPLERLSEAARVVGQGQFDIQVAATSRDEIGELGDSFNQMAAELKGTQAALVQSEKMAAFGQLGAGITHEIKNPLGGVLGLAQLCLRKVEKDSPLAKNLAIIEKEASRCRTIIENLLKFARQEKVAFGPLDLNRVTQDALTIVAHQLSINQIKVKQDLCTDLPTLTGNPNQLQQVLINFLINAQQAMEGNPGTVSLSTRLTETGGAQVRVSDSGPGIPEEIRSRIFEPFFTTKEAGKGTGLGLSVTYGIIQDHCGEIEVESTVGEGTTFIITLPPAGTAEAPPAAEGRCEEAV